MRHLYRLSCQCALTSFVGGSLIGFSPVLEQLNFALQPEEALSERAGTVASARGVNAFAISFVLAGIFTLLINSYAKQQPWLKWAALAFTPLSTGMAILFSAVAVITQQAAIVYLLVTPLLAGGLAGLVYVQNVVFLQAWLREGRAHVGAALVGASLGVGTLLFTLLPGILVNELGSTTGLFAYAGVMMALGLLGVIVSLSGWASPQEQDGEAQLANTTAQNQLSRAKMAEKPADTQHTVQGEDLRTVVTSSRHYLVTLDGFLFTMMCVLTYLAGLGTKGILTAMFLRIFPDLSFYEATVLATTSLVLYVVIRSAFPLLGSKMNMSLPMAGISLVGCVLFAALPAMLQANLTAWGFTGILSATGAVFALGTTLIPLVGAQFFDAQLYPLAVGTSSALSLYGSTIGILASWYLSSANLATGKDPRMLFNSTFYMYAAVYGTISLISSFFYLKKRSSLRAQDTKVHTTSNIHVDVETASACVANSDSRSEGHMGMNSQKDMAESKLPDQMSIIICDSPGSS